MMRIVKLAMKPETKSNCEFKIPNKKFQIPSPNNYVGNSLRKDGLQCI